MKISLNKKDYKGLKRLSMGKKQSIDSDFLPGISAFYDIKKLRKFQDTIRNAIDCRLSVFYDVETQSCQVSLEFGLYARLAILNLTHPETREPKLIFNYHFRDIKRKTEKFRKKGFKFTKRMEKVLTT